MKKLIILFLNVSIFFSSTAQSEFGLKANVGLSKISSNLQSAQQYFEPSRQIGIFYNYSFKNKFLLGADILYTAVKGKEQLNIEIIDGNGLPTGEIARINLDRNISYTGIPVYIGYKANRLSVNAGMQLSITLVDQGNESGILQLNNETNFTWDNDPHKLYLNKYNWGAFVGLSLNVTSKIAINGIYYWSINNIIDTGILSTSKWNIRLLSFGAQFFFGNNSLEKNVEQLN